MALACPECGFDLKPQFFESPDYRACHVCGEEISLRAFPACFAPPKLISAADLSRQEDEASCFYHDSKRAAESCSQCGRFLCALCAAEFGGHVLCPGCIVSSEKKNRAGGRIRVERLERERTLYDSLALMLATLPLLTISLSIIGAPAAIYVALRYWNRPSSIVRRWNYRKYLALSLGLLEVTGWVWLLVYSVLRASRQFT